MKSFDFEIEVTSNGEILSLNGKIDEDTNLIEALSSTKTDNLTIDLSGIVSLNSYGVRVWINAFSNFSNKFFTFQKVPSAIINQMNMISNFMPKESWIESFYAPYYCDNCDTEEDVLYTTDSLDIKIKELKCKACGGDLEFDELEDEYFQFLENLTKTEKKSAHVKSYSCLDNQIIVAIEGKDDLGARIAQQISGLGYDVCNISLKKEPDLNIPKCINELTKLVICGYINTEESLNEITNLKKNFPHIKFIMLTEDKLRKILVEDWIHSFYPDNIITFEYENLDTDLKEINTVIEKILSNDIFGIDRYLNNEKKISEMTIKTARKKTEYLSDIMEFAESNGVRRRILSSIEQIADELIMNAIYNAPADETGNDKYKMVLRSEKIDLQEEEFALLKYGVDDNKFVISVTDYFGRLTKDKVLGYLHKCFSDTNFKVNEESGGAGLGLYIIYSKVQQFVINIKPGVKTEVITSFYLNKKPKDAQNKMFHIFIN